MDLGISGLASGFDWRTLVDKLIQAERQPETLLQRDQTLLQNRNNAYGTIKTELSVLNNRLEQFQQTAFFSTRQTTSSDTDVATVTALAGAALGQYAFNIIRLATASKQLGAANLGSALSSSADVSGVTLSSAPLALAVQAGTFTVNGKQVQVTGSDTLQQVFDKISAATGGSVSASYDPATDRITLSGSSEIVLGSATDTSNFLRAFKLANNGTSTITSSNALGSVKLNGNLSGANLATAVSDGGTGAGEFKINGVTISFSATTDSLQNVLDRINDSSAGVTANYDAINDRVVLTSKATGDMGIALEDVTGNFLAATGLLSGSLQHGQDLAYTINGGPELTSQSNTITEESSGITGLSLNVQDTGPTTATVASDTDTIKNAITSFIDQYNKVQALIDTQTASSTDATGKVTAGVLAQDNDADEIASRLRSIASGHSDLTSAFKSLEDLGIVSNGYDNKLELADSTKLDAALSENLTAVGALFTDATAGIATRLHGYLDQTVGDDGTLLKKQDSLTNQSSEIDKQIADMERYLADERQRLIDSFTAMEQAQARSNQQLQFLLQKFGTSSSS